MRLSLLSPFRDRDTQRFTPILRDLETIRLHGVVVFADPGDGIVVRDALNVEKAGDLLTWLDTWNEPRATVYPWQEPPQGLSAGDRHEWILARVMEAITAHKAG
jgi:hypothetical protein